MRKTSIRHISKGKRGPVPYLAVRTIDLCPDESASNREAVLVARAVRTKSPNLWYHLKLSVVKLPKSVQW